MTNKQDFAEQKNPKQYYIQYSVLLNHRKMETFSDEQILTSKKRLVNNLAM
jgi:hypothetical protein